MLFIPFFDDLLRDLKSRFNEDVMSVYDLDVVLPNIAEIKTIFDDKYNLETKLKNVINQFGDLVACELNTPRDIFDKTLIVEFTCWHNYCLRENKLPTSPLKALVRCNLDCFSGIYITITNTNHIFSYKCNSRTSFFIVTEKQNMDEVKNVRGPIKWTS